MSEPEAGTAETAKRMAHPGLVHDPDLVKGHELQPVQGTARLPVPASPLPGKGQPDDYEQADYLDQQSGTPVRHATTSSNDN